LLDTMHKATAHITIPFGPRPQLINVSPDSLKRKKTDSAVYGKTDTNGQKRKLFIRKANDSAALKPTDKPVVQKDSNTNQSP
jgi:hypothetical protein